MLQTLILVSGGSRLVTSLGADKVLEDGELLNLVLIVTLHNCKPVSHTWT